MSTFKIEIELFNEFGFARSGQSMTVDPSKLPASIVAELVMHGIVQKVGDAAAGKDGTDAKDAMAAVWERLANGEWTGRKPGGASDPHGAYRKHIRDIMRPAVKAKHGKANIELIDQEFDGLADDKQMAVIKTAKARHERELRELAEVAIEL
jgi:hypothetical protein